MLCVQSAVGREPESRGEEGVCEPRLCHLC